MSDYSEIIFLQEELKDIRKVVGGRAIKLGKDFIPVSVDDDIDLLKKSIGEVANDVKKLQSQVDALSLQLSQTQTVSAEDQQALETLSSELHTTTDALEKEVKSKT
jgi:peptidoglycan hydrolase CwlO-like protein